MTPATWLAWASPFWLLGLPLAALPWWRGAGVLLPTRRFSHLPVLPADAASRWMHRALRAAASLAMAALCLALAGPYRPEYEVERQGQGAEIVLLLDRSRSMDQSFTNGAGPLNRFTANYSVASDRPASDRQSKAETARQLLSEFTAGRRNDRFGMVLFSAMPLKVLEFTQKPEAIQAAISAAGVGRGVSDTDIGQALLEGVAMFDQRAYTGSRVLLLVSDGGDHVEPTIRERFALLMRRHRVSLVWIYIRSPRSPGLMADAQTPPENADTVPEYFLHRFFQSLPTPYRAYEAENPEALQRAIADLDRLENLPITYTDTVPRRELAPLCLALALAAVAGLLLARRLSLRAWA